MDLDRLQVLLDQTGQKLSPHMMGVRIFSHRDYRVGDRKFSTYREAWDYLHSGEAVQVEPGV